MSEARIAACILLSTWLVPVAQAQGAGAQVRAPAGVLVGARLGFDLSKVNASAVDPNRGGGALVSVSVAAPVTRHFWLQPEVGLSARQSDVTYRGERMCRITFLDVSTLAVLRGRMGSTGPFAGVGPAVALRVSSTLSEHGGWYGSNPTAWRRTDFQLVGTLGVSSYISARTTMSVDVRYWHGLLDLDPSVDHSDPRVRSWQLRVGFERNTGRSHTSSK